MTNEINQVNQLLAMLDEQKEDELYGLVKGRDDCGFYNVLFIHFIRFNLIRD